MRCYRKKFLQWLNTTVGVILGIGMLVRRSDSGAEARDTCMINRVYLYLCAMYSLSTGNRAALQPTANAALPLVFKPINK